MEYLPNYLRKYAHHYESFEVAQEDEYASTIHMETVTTASSNPSSIHQNAVTYNLPSLLKEAANEIEELRKKVKELEYVQRIIYLAQSKERI